MEVIHRRNLSQASDAPELMKLRLSRRSMRMSWADLEDPESDRGDDLRRITYMTNLPPSEGTSQGSERSKGESRSSSSMEYDSGTKLEESSSASSNAAPGSEQASGSSSTATVHKDETGTIPLDDLELSIGSSAHWTGDCNPCIWAHKRAGCQNGFNCTFCHFTHQRKQRVRPCKGRRDRFHKNLDRMHKDLDENADTVLNDPNWLDKFASTLPTFVQNQPDLKFRVIQTLAKHAERVLLSKKYAPMRDERLRRPDSIAGSPHLVCQSADPSSSSDMHHSNSEYAHHGRQSTGASCGKACFKTSL